MAEVIGWQGVAFNQATESENRIHSNEVARQYGFRGGLVPGVTVYAYLVHPAVEQWGLDWLERGAASVALRKPLYDGAKFDVLCEPAPGAGGEGYRGRVVDEDGVECATGLVRAPAEDGTHLVRRGDPPSPPRDEIPAATRAAVEALRERGMGSVRFRWPGGGEMDRYTRDADDMPELLRADRGGYANPAFTLGIANFVLSRNVALGPWIHAQSDVRNLAAVPHGSELVAEGRVADAFERGGHEFVDLEVAVFLESDTPVLSARHRAIYRLREVP